VTAAEVEPTGLLVDYGGVLTTPVSASFRAFFDEAGVAREHVKEVFLSAYRSGDVKGPIARLETGELDAEAVGRALAAALTARSGVPLEGADLIARLFARVELDERMLGAVEALRRAGVRTGLLSNSWGDSGYPRERFPALFDAVVISGEVGLRKPDRRIYEHAAEALGLPCERCVFVDDLEVNVRAAEGLGMAGVVHRSAAATLPVLADLFGLTAAHVDPVADP
jgi:epoxide hydrolase-like predicted phosphatase